MQLYKYWTNYLSQTAISYLQSSRMSSGKKYIFSKNQINSVSAIIMKNTFAIAIPNVHEYAEHALLENRKDE